jgi:hypothetical protein
MLAWHWPWPGCCEIGELSALRHSEQHTLPVLGMRIEDAAKWENSKAEFAREFPRHRSSFPAISADVSRGLPLFYKELAILHKGSSPEVYLIGTFDGNNSCNLTFVRVTVHAFCYQALQD